MYNLGEEKTVITVDCGEVERLIQKEYGFDEFSIPCNEEMGNDCTLEVDVDGEVDEWGAKEIKERKQMFMTRDYMNDLAKRGLIKKGVYMIDISW